MEKFYLVTSVFRCSATSEILRIEITISMRSLKKMRNQKLVSAIVDKIAFTLLLVIDCNFKVIIANHSYFRRIATFLHTKQLKPAYVRSSK